MEPRGIDQLLAALTPGKYGWQITVPTAAGTFLAHAVELQIQTQPIPRESPPPSPNADEVKLVRTILGALRQILEVIEREFRSHVTDWEPDPVGLVCNPHFWIDRDMQEDDGPSRWAFVVEQEGAPDYGLHLEFDGL